MTEQKKERRARKQAEYNRLRTPDVNGVRYVSKGRARQKIQTIK